MTEQDIDWDCEKAKGCDWALTPNSMGTIIFCCGKPREDEEENRWLNAGVIAGYPLLGSYTLHTRPKAKEMIYTKQMQEAGWFCKVGMMFETEAGQYKSLFQNETSVVFEDEEMFLVAIPNGQVKPIDTRTDKQKLSDQIDNFIIDKNINAIDTEKLIDAIMNGEFENIKYTGEK